MTKLYCIDTKKPVVGDEIEITIRGTVVFANAGTITIEDANGWRRYINIESDVTILRRPWEDEAERIES